MLSVLLAKLDYGLITQVWGVGATNGVYPALKAGSPPAGVPDLAVNTMRHHNTIATVVAFFFWSWRCLFNPFAADKKEKPL